uniref:Putative conserved plasma membrane protein n=1 Tax=Ixodes ricinus TaxID=34613 RepID=A0A090XDM1_IXORI
MMAATVCSMALAIFGNARIVFGGKTPIDHYVKLPRRKERLLHPLVPLAGLTGCLWLCFGGGLMESHPVMFLVTFGFAFAKLTIRLVLTTVSFGEVDLWDSSLVAPLSLCLHLLLSATSMSLPVSSALMGSMVYSVMDFARFFTYASWDIRDALDVWIFPVKHPVGDPRCKNGNNGLYLERTRNNDGACSRMHALTLSTVQRSHSSRSNRTDKNWGFLKRWPVAGRLRSALIKPHHARKRPYSCRRK